MRKRNTENVREARGKARRTWIGFAIGTAFACLMAQDDARADGPYQLGHGYNIGPLNIAGYVNAVASSQRNGPDEVLLDDLSLFVSGHFNRFFNPFIEVELADFSLAGNNGPHGQGEFVLERFYNDSSLTNTLTLRIGQMLAPVGQWNEIHAAPLALSGIRPAVTFRNFSEYATGLSLLYTDPLGKLPDLQVYWQPGGELAERPSSLTNHRYEQVAGAHLSYALGLLDKVGVSLQRSTDEQKFDQTLLGIDYQYTFHDVTLQGEATYSFLDSAPVGGLDSEWGFYAAAKYKISDELSVHAWYETFADRNGARPAQDVLAGFSWRPVPAMVARFEYIQNFGGPRVNGTGVYASWSVLF